MKIFVAGATGVLGRPAVKALVEAGHTVRGGARGEDKAALHMEQPAGCPAGRLIRWAGDYAITSAAVHS